MYALEKLDWNEASASVTESSREGVSKTTAARCFQTVSSWRCSVWGNPADLSPQTSLQRSDADLRKCATLKTAFPCFFQVMMTIFRYEKHFFLSSYLDSDDIPTHKCAQCLFSVAVVIVSFFLLSFITVIYHVWVILFSCFYFKRLCCVVLNCLYEKFYANKNQLIDWCTLLGQGMWPPAYYTVQLPQSFLYSFY